MYSTTHPLRVQVPGYTERIESDVSISFQSNEMAMSLFIEGV